MKIIISEEGFLEIERAGKIKTQICPFSGGFCQDSCPRFFEPEDTGTSKIKRICICGVVLKGEIIDSRQKQEVKYRISEPVEI